MSGGGFQPYRKGHGMPGLAKVAMQRGRTAAGFNPKDLERNVQTMMRAKKHSRKRPARPSRPERPARPPR